MIFWHQIFFAFWFFLPAGLANMFPIFVAHTPGLRNLEFPMDFGLSWRGRRIFGSNKTMRGLVTGIVIAIITVLIQQSVYTHWNFLRAISPIDYQVLNPYLLGLLLALGALIGDAVESFFKRQLDIPVGQSWLIFDQLDYVAGGILFTIGYVRLSWDLYLYIVLIFFVLHLLSTIIGYFLGLKKTAI